MKVITLKLSILEAKALNLALGNTTEWSDVMDNIFIGDTQGKRAAYRAGNKLKDAIREYHNPKL